MPLLLWERRDKMWRTLSMTSIHYTCTKKPLHMQLTQLIVTTCGWNKSCLHSSHQILMCHWKIWPSRGALRKVTTAIKRFRLLRNCRGKAITRPAQGVEFLDTLREHVPNRYKLLCSCCFFCFCPSCTYVTNLWPCMQAEVHHAASDSCHAPSQPSTFIMIPTPQVILFSSAYIIV